MDQNYVNILIPIEEVYYKVGILFPLLFIANGQIRTRMLGRLYLFTFY